MMLNNFILYLVLTIVYFLTFESNAASASVFVNQTVYLSSPRTAFGSIQVNNKIYFAGGFGYHDYIASNVVDVLDLSNNNMSQLTLGTARGMITPVVIEPRIYFIGGFSYLNVPFKLDAGSFTVSSNSLTSGPTVRRPTKLALYGSTLTVIGAYSVDFMNIQTGLWSTNPQLTSKMMTRYNTTTFAHLNYVFVFGGYDMKTDAWSSSVWVIDSPSTAPVEFVNQATEQQIISSTLDEANRAVVFQYSDMVMVYHMADQQFYTRDISGYVTSLSFFDSTIVCASNGYWTFEWTSLSITWTPVTDLTLAFAIGDQFVYTARDGSGVWTLFINVHGNPSPISSPTSDLQAEVISLVTKLSDTVLVFVTQRGSVFKYDSIVQQYARYSILASQPLHLFRVNNSTFVLVSRIGPATSSTVAIMDSNIVTVVNSRDFDFTPMAFLNGQLIDIFTGNRVDLSWTSATILGSRIPPTSIWAQDGSNFFVMATASLIGTPTFLLGLSTRVDVYNYEEEKWESPLTAPGTLAQQGYYPAAVFNDTIVIPRNGNVEMYSRQSGWTSTSIPELKTVLQDLQTFVPAPFVNDMAYFPYFGPSFSVITLPPNLEISNFEVSAANTKYIVANQSKMLFVATTVPTLNLIYATIITYDFEANQYDSTIIPNPVPDASLVVYDDFLLVFGANSSGIDYFYPSNFGWATESFDNSFLPTVLHTLKVGANASTSSNSSSLLMIAGGRHRERYYYSDVVRFMTLNLTIPVAPVTAPETTPAAQEPVASPAAEDNSTTIIIAVVVPVGVVVVAGVLLAVLLTLRNKRRKNRVTTTSELEARYGQWFTPFHEIQFGNQLGQGANGQVFEGTWKNSKVALKVSPTQANASVISELEVMMKMRPHPNVIQLFGFSVRPETGSVILILEFCNGGALDAVLYDSQKPITMQQKMAWIIGAAQGLSHLHSNNIIHRDVAARNILLQQNEPKLIDFGMSRFVEEDQRGTTRSELGPIRWMSPESLRNKQYSNKSDVWSFGVLMYEIMAQEEPHSTADPIDIARQIRDQGLTPTIPSSCPSSIATWMQKCWQIEPEKRPTMEQIVSEENVFKND